MESAIVKKRNKDGLKKSFGGCMARPYEGWGGIKVLEGIVIKVYFVDQVTKKLGDEVAMSLFRSAYF